MLAAKETAMTRQQTLVQARPAGKPADDHREDRKSRAGGSPQENPLGQAGEPQASTPANHEERLGRQIDDQALSGSDLSARDPDALPTRTPMGRGPRR
jgi:hypothetical protein